MVLILFLDSILSSISMIMNFLGGVIGYFAFAVYKKTRS